ncbi:lysine-specific permease [Chytriomyces sp. MP71]|nr:lysine-specific permease [Chytriomyces sp. MP71]
MSLPIDAIAGARTLPTISLHGESADTLVVETSAKNEDTYVPANKGRLHRKLEPRHLQMIALGGTIGTGLFVGIGGPIAVAGPLGVLVAFAIVAVMVFSVVVAIGEIATQVPCSGAFGELTARFLDPDLGFTLGWNYYFQWLLTIPAELSALGVIPTVWAPNVPAWVFTLIFLVILLALNFVGVKVYGEIEYWLSFMKVISVTIFIMIATAIVCGANHEFGVLGFRNWNGENIPGAPISSFSSVMACFTMAFYSYGGTELIGVTAGEAKNPKVSIPRAIKGTVFRIILFYMLALFLIGLILPMNDPTLSDTNVMTSPFTRVLQLAGIPVAPHIMNAVILIAIFSSINGAIYASTRTLQSLAANSNAPQFLTATTSRGVPVASTGLTAFAGSLSLIGAYVGNGVVFSVLTNLLSVSALLCWACILATHLNFRYAWRKTGRRDEELLYASPFFPWLDILGLLIGAFVLGSFLFNALSSPFDIVSDAPYVGGLPLFVLPYLVRKLIAFNRTGKLSFGVDWLKMDFDSNNNGGMYETEADEVVEFQEPKTIWGKVVAALA